MRASRAPCYWRGAGLDRLLDARHASLVAASVRRLERARVGKHGSRRPTPSMANVARSMFWALSPECGPSWSRRSNRSSRTSRRRSGSSTRRFAWSGRRSPWTPSGGSQRSSVEHWCCRTRRPPADALPRSSPYLGVAFPDRGSAVRQWLREPSGALAGILFLPDIATGDGKSDRRGDRPLGGHRDPRFQARISLRAIGGTIRARARPRPPPRPPQRHF